MTPGRIVALIFGVIIALIAFALVVGGGDPQADEDLDPMRGHAFSTSVSLRGQPRTCPPPPGRGAGSLPV
jgi:hypothetical protein